ncbi:hypothetical protein B0H17DRAFT_1124491 [Mycena rosella]|uniref:Uncharacterized protein n=1 Tax=Mycena rosella TaxID=1033263 RepID=A0AAD7GZ61_MYCRO|nr:hypothetical protein B0H17DRAFT_1124491 [Mycena rosella]
MPAETANLLMLAALVEWLVMLGFLGESDQRRQWGCSGHFYELCSVQLSTNRAGCMEQAGPDQPDPLTPQLLALKFPYLSGRTYPDGRVRNPSRKISRHGGGVCISSTCSLFWNPGSHNTRIYQAGRVLLSEQERQNSTKIAPSISLAARTRKRIEAPQPGNIADDARGKELPQPASVATCCPAVYFWPSIRNQRSVCKRRERKTSEPRPPHSHLPRLQLASETAGDHARTASQDETAPRVILQGPRRAQTDSERGPSRKIADYARRKMSPTVFPSEVVRRNWLPVVTWSIFGRHGRSQRALGGSRRKRRGAHQAPESRPWRPSPLPPPKPPPSFGPLETLARGTVS